MVSVVIPVYNTSKFLRKCLNSVLSQTYRDLEIIIINDASTDNSLKICNEFQKKDNRIKIIDLVHNKGLEASRIMGLNLANGEWVMYVDSDDSLSGTHVIEDNLKLAIKHKVDIVQFGAKKVTKKKLLSKNFYKLKCEIISSPEIMTKYYPTFFGLNHYPCNLWGKLFRTSMLKSVPFQQLGIFLGEDESFMIQLTPFLNSIFFNPYIGYNYLLGGGSSNYVNFFNDAKKLFSLKKKMIEKYGMYELTDSIYFELKNFLRTDIINRVKQNKFSEDEIIDYISNIIHEDMQDIIIFYKEKVPREKYDSFVKLLVKNDVYGIYKLCYSIYKKNRYKDFLRYFTRNLF